jgi:hypothetical protein
MRHLTFGATVVGALALVALSATVALAFNRGAAHSCPTHHVQILRQAGGVRILVDVGHPVRGERAIVLCAHGHGVILGEKLTQSEDQNDQIIAVLITGHYGALVQNDFASDGDGQVNVVVGNTTTHSLAVNTFASGEVDNDVARAVLGANGAIAWVDDSGILKMARHGGPAGGCVLDHGPVTATSLYRSGNTVTWDDGATPHAAPLTAASCVP